MPQKMAVTVGFLLAWGILDAQIVTTTALASVTPAAPLFGQAVTLTAQVIPATAPGTVAFMDGGVLVGVGTLNTGGIAQMTTITLPSGTHLLRAVYGGGTGGYLASQSAAQSYVVTTAAGAGFAPLVNYSAGINPYSVAVGDFNGDGKADLALANYASNNVSVLLGNGDGTFATAMNYDSGTNPHSVAVGDFNGDGNADLAVANQNGNNVSVLLGHGDGTFQAAANYGVGAGPYCIAVGDFNGDGKADLAVVNAFAYTDNISVLLGNGNGTFQTALNFGAGIMAPFSLAVADFNGDGKADLAVADYLGINGNTGINVSMLLGNGNGTFQAAANYNANIFPESVAAGDFNGDGKADLAVANSFTNDVSVLLGNGDGTLQFAVDYHAGIGSDSVAVGDFNGDGMADLAVTNGAGDNLSVFSGNGDGTFQAAVNHSVGMSPVSVAVGDFNGDGRADLAVANFDSNSVSVLLGASPVAVPNVVGLTQAAATMVITGVGLVVGTVTTAPSNSVPAGNVISENPAAGTPVSPSSAVNLVVSVGPPVPVPNVVGFTQAAATTGITGVGLAVGTVTTAFSNAVAAGNVISENPVAGTLVSPSSVVNLVVSKGPSASIPNVVGFTRAAAATAITGVGLVLGTVTTVLSNTVPAGNVISEDPAAGTVVGTGSAVNLIISGAAPISAGPSSGSGLTQTFTFTFNAPDGFAGLTVVDVLINNFLDGRNACYIAFVPSGASSGSVFLVDDAGDSGGNYTGMVLPGTSTVQNSQCSIAGTGSSVGGSDNTLTLTLAITFQAPFAGDKVVYIATQDMTLTNSGWHPLGTWNVPGEAPVGPWVSGVTSVNGTSATQSLVFTFTDTNGFADISIADILINNFLDGIGACYVAYVPEINELLLVDDAGDAGGPYAGAFLLGPGTASNSQCTVNGAASSVSGSGNTLTLTLNITFNHNFAGDKVIYAAARSNSANSGWLAVGTESVP